MPRNLRIGPRSVVLYSDFNAVIILLAIVPASSLLGSLVSKTEVSSTYNSTRAPFVVYKLESAEDWSSPSGRGKAFIVWYYSRGDCLSPYRDLRSLTFAFGVTLGSIHSIPSGSSM